MRLRPRVAAAPILVVSCSLGLSAQSPSKKPLEGVWKVAEVVVTGAGARTVTAPQPGLAIFSSGHYSMIGVVGDKPRTLFAAEEPTTAEKIAAYDTFFANAGTYEVSASTLTIHPMVARMPNFMAGGFAKYQFRIDGNTLWLTNRTGDESHRIGQKVAPATGPAAETRTRYVRVE